MSVPIKHLAQTAVMQINTGTAAVPNWVEVKGLTAINYSPSKTDVDITDFNSGTYNESMVARRGASWTLTGHRLSAADGSRDPGQAAVEALQTQTGANATGHFQYLLPDTQAYEFYAHANVTAFGGANDAVMTWNAELTMTGALTVV